MEGHRVTADGKMLPGIPGQLVMMQVLPPAGQKPPDLQGPMPAAQGPLPSVPALQTKGRPMQAPYNRCETMTYCPPPGEYVQQHPQSQPCHLVGKPYYRQSMYHSQQTIVNHQVPHASPPLGQHQSIYFRPGRSSGPAYSGVQGSSHSWGDYRLRMDQMQGYSASQQCGSPGLYVNPVPVDQRMADFGTPIGVSLLEAQRFGSPTPRGYAAGHGYYDTHMQQYQPYMAPPKSNNVPWHSPDRQVQLTVDQPHGKHAVLAPNIPEVDFPRAMSSPVGINVPHNYIPGRRLEHFSPTMQGGAALMSPHRQSAECLEEFPGHQYAMYGPTLSSGGQFRQTVPTRLQGRAVDVGRLQQGPNVYGSNVYQPQMFGDAQPQGCNYTYHHQLQSPKFYHAVNPKSDPGGQFCNQETGTLARSNLPESQIARWNVPDQGRLLKAGESTAAASVKVPISALSPSLEETVSSSIHTNPVANQNCDADESNRNCNTQNATAMLTNGFSRSSSTVDIGPTRSNPVTPGSAISVFSNSLNDGNRGKEDMGRNFLTDITGVATSLPRSLESRHLSSCVSVPSNSSVVTQMVSTSTTAAVTVSVADSVSRRCLLATASANALGALKTEKLMLSHPIPSIDPQLNSSISFVHNAKNSDTAHKSISDHSPIAKSETQTVKIEPTFPSTRRRVVRGAKKKKVPTATLR